MFQNTNQDVGPGIESLNGAQKAALSSVTFPDISFEDFKELPYIAQRSIIARNRIINSDTYNRTMDELSSSLPLIRQENYSTEDRGSLGLPATFTLQMRRSPFGYLVAAGIQDTIEDLTLLPITENELRFAREYFQHTSVPFFNDKMWSWIVHENQGRLPIKIYGVPDGTIVAPGEPLLNVQGPEELVAHFEHVFHRLFYATLVATRAHALTEIIGDSSRFVEVGKRGAITEEQHLQALKAAYIGGGISLTSNDAAPGILPVRDTGTIGHRYVQRFDSEEAAFRHAIENLPAVTLLVDLVNTYEGINLACKLKEEYRDTGKKIWVRLDSGDILDQVRYFLTVNNKLGFTDSALDKVVVEGLDSLGEIAEIEKMIVGEFGEDAKKRVVYGAGGLLISEKTSRADASTGLKLSEYTTNEGALCPTMKFSDSPGKESFPGVPQVAIVNGKRQIVQMGEQLSGQVKQLFEPLYENGQAAYERIELARARVIAQSEQVTLGITKAEASQQTQNLIREVRARYAQSQN